MLEAVHFKFMFVSKTSIECYCYVAGHTVGFVIAVFFYNQTPYEKYATIPNRSQAWLGARSTT
jgi:hypothetical protein